MTVPSGVNLPVMLRSHLAPEVRTLREDIAALEARTNEKRALLLQHLQVAVVMGVDVDAPPAAPAPLADAEEPKDS